ncbi:MAG: hypothetical protein ACHQ03_07205 [Candidatus Bathyarchaeia archaeon]
MKVSYSLVIIAFLLGYLVVVPMSSTASPLHLASSGYLDLSPNSGPVGIEIGIAGQVTTPNLDQSCSISSPTSGTIIAGEACTVNGGGSVNGNFTGSFTVGNVSPGQYVIEVTACAGNDGCTPSSGDFVQAIFQTQGQPVIEISPGWCCAVPGSTVQVFGSGFSLNDNPCTITGPAVLSYSCKISGGSLTGLFVVANVPSGYYEVAATGSPTGDSANANVGVGS